MCERECSHISDEHGGAKSAVLQSADDVMGDVGVVRDGGGQIDLAWPTVVPPAPGVATSTSL